MDRSGVPEPPAITKQMKEDLKSQASPNRVSNRLKRLKNAQKRK